MTTYRISEVARRGGIPVSTLRYYERIGLVRPDARRSNGYREYDERALERLAFIGRAQRMGMALDEVAELADLWFSEECGPIQERLNRFLSDRIDQVRNRIAEDTAFERQLQLMRARLTPAKAPDGRCSPDCGCDLADPSPGDGAPAISWIPPGTPCTLSASEAEERVARWERLAALAQHQERHGDQVRICFPAAADLAAELAGLCAAETRCCPSLHFTLEVSPAATVLMVSPAGLRPPQ